MPIQIPELDLENLGKKNVDNVPCYESVVRGSDKLLITVGDSWTWGASLGDNRIEEIYGGVLSKKLDTDFLNLAIRGGANAQMHDLLKTAWPRVVDQYQHIYVVVTLTELAREVMSDPLWTTMWTQEQDNLRSLDQLLQSYEQKMLKSFADLFDSFTGASVLIGRNFTRTYDDNVGILSRVHLHHTWIDLLSEYQGLDGYPANLRFLSGQSLQPLMTYLKNIKMYGKFRQDLCEKFFEAEEAINWLDESTLNHKQATRHPTAEAHQIWADYLYFNFSNGLNKYYHARRD